MNCWLSPKIMTLIGTAGCIIYFGLIGYYYCNNDEKNGLGTMGDFIGGMLNPFLAFVSFMAVLCMVKLQSKELRNSSQELKLTRLELKGSKKAQQDSASALKQQRFEMTFFALLDTINTNIMTFKQKYPENINQIPSYAYPDFNLNFSKVAILIYQLLKLIDNYNESDKNNCPSDRTYSNILRACLDQEILKALTVHCEDVKIDKMDKYIEYIRKYRILEHMNFYKKDAFNKTTVDFRLIKLIDFYGEEAFGDNVYINLDEVKKYR